MTFNLLSVEINFYLYFSFNKEAEASNLSRNTRKYAYCTVLLLYLTFTC